MLGLSMYCQIITDSEFLLCSQEQLLYVLRERQKL